MKIVLPGGTGQIGRMLVRHFLREGHDCVVLSRSGRGSEGARGVQWDGRSPGNWTAELDGANVVINLAGRSVDCRYTERNLREMMDSRVDSVRAVGAAIACAVRPPRVWLQAATATIYAHRFDAANDEATGLMGGTEPGVPEVWRRSIEIAQAWERELVDAKTPNTRKIALRSAMIMSPGRGGVFDVLAKLCWFGLGRHGDGKQYVSWIHEDDFVAAVDFLIARADLDGVFNLAAPGPLPSRDFIGGIHAALGRKIALPLPAWALELGALLMQTETELILKSRRVVPARLNAAGFRFRHAEWGEAARDLVGRLQGAMNSSKSNRTPP